MRRITQEELNKIIERHQHWLKEDCYGWEKMRADLRDADLRGADLEGANLSDADLSCANLRYTDLKGAKLDEDEKIRKGITLAESMVGYKNCKGDAIVELEIPAGSIVFSINNNKCRTNKAIVKSISDMYGNKIDRAYSKHKFFSYYVGDVINIKDFNMAYNVECATGIHFFRTFEEAECYFY